MARTFMRIVVSLFMYVFGSVSTGAALTLPIPLDPSYDIVLPLPSKYDRYPYFLPDRRKFVPL